MQLHWVTAETQLDYFLAILDMTTTMVLIEDSGISVKVEALELRLFEQSM